MPPIKDGRGQPTAAIPQVQLGIVSPCSTCKNQRAQAKDGLPACPRRVLLQLAQDTAKAGTPLPASYSPALLTGTEGTDQEGSNALANPVYSDEQKHILIWVAHLQDNMGLHDDQGRRIVGPLLDSSFDTNYIQCNSMPYVVRDTEASYFSAGAYREWDTVEAMALQSFHLDGRVAGANSEFDPIKIEGLAKKVDLAFGFNRNPVEKDLAPRGT